MERDFFMESQFIQKALRSIDMNSKFTHMQTQNDEEVLKNLLHLVSDKHHVGMNTLELAAYALVYSNLDSTEFDVALEKYQQFLPTGVQQQFESKLLPNWTFYGLYKHRYTKLRMLSTAILNSLEHNIDKARLELQRMFNDLFMRSEYRSVIKYINKLACHGRDIPKYWDYLDSKYQNITEKEEVTRFMNYNIVYAYFASQRMEDRLSNFVKTKRNGKISNIFSLLNDKEELLAFIVRINAWVKERTEQDQKLITYKNFLYEGLDKQTVPMKMTFERRVKLFLATLVLSGEITTAFTEISTDKILEDTTGYKQGKVNAASLIVALDPYDNEGDVFVDGEVVLNRFFDLNYAFEYILLKRLGVDIETLLTNTIITYEELEEIVLSYALCGDLENSIYRSLLSPHIKFDTPAVTLNDFEDVSDAFVGAKNYVIRGIVTTALAKHLNLMSGELDSLYLNQKVKLSTNAVVKTEMQNDEELELANEQINILDAELNATKNELKIIKLQAQNKEQILQEKLDAFELKYKLLQDEHTILRSNYDAFIDAEDDVLGEDILFDSFEVDSEETNEDDAIDYIEEMRGLKICIVGGFVNFHNNIRDSFPTEPTFVEARFYNYPLSMLLNQDIVVHVAVHNNHPQYKRVRNYMKRHQCKNRLFVINAQHSPKLLAKKIYEYRLKNN